MNRYFRAGFIFLLMVVSLGLTGTASAAGAAVVSVSAPAQPVSPGAQFTVSINVQPNNSIAGVQFNLSFNPSLVLVNSVAEGNLLKQNGASSYFNPGQINNTAGTLTGVSSVIISPGQTVSTTGTLAVITLTARTIKGNCSLDLSNVVVGDINGSGLTVNMVNGQVVVNSAPVLSIIGNKSVNEGALLNFTLSAIDADGDTLTYSASNLPSGATFNTSTRTFSWTPNYVQAGSYPNVHFQVSDGSLTDSEDISITVNNVGQAPVLGTIGNKSVNEGVLLSFTISATDGDGDTLTYSASNLPIGATFNTSTRTFFWTPNYVQAGSYPNVHFQVSDGSLTDSEDISITVNNVSQAPVLNSIGNKSVNEGSLLSFTISATDADGDTLTYSASNLPSGAAFNTSTRTFSWTPSYAQAGSYSNVHFQVSDGSLTDSEDISITVNNVSQAPVLNSIGNKSVNEGSLLSFTISATDADGDTLTYSASNLPSGAAFNTSTRTFSWTPNYAQAGSYPNVHFQVSDGSLTDSEDISITANQLYAAWDTNRDSAVNVLDLLLVGQHWNESGVVGWIQEDVNTDGTISILDNILIGQHWTG
jgi:hypothetical protein